VIIPPGAVQTKKNEGPAVERHVTLLLPEPLEQPFEVEFEMKGGTFIGDYNGMAVGSDGKIHSVWTDMRRNASPPFPNRAVQDAFYASIPAPAP
jgi:hypothetical protein